MQWPARAKAVNVRALIVLRNTVHVGVRDGFVGLIVAVLIVLMGKNDEWTAFFNC